MSLGDGSKPSRIRRSFAQDELVKAMTDWMVEIYGNPRELTEDARNRWYERNGMMHHFITDLFEK